MDFTSMKFRVNNRPLKLPCMPYQILQVKLTLM